MPSPRSEPVTDTLKNDFRNLWSHRAYLNSWEADEQILSWFYRISPIVCLLVTALLIPAPALFRKWCIVMSIILIVGADPELWSRPAYIATVLILCWAHQVHKQRVSEGRAFVHVALQPVADRTTRVSERGPASAKEQEQLRPVTPLTERRRISMERLSDPVQTSPHIATRTFSAQTPRIPPPAVRHTPPTSDLGLWWHLARTRIHGFFWRHAVLDLERNRETWGKHVDDGDPEVNHILGRIVAEVEERSRFPMYWGKTRIPDELELQKFLRTRNDERRQIIDEDFRSPDSLGIDGLFFITRDGMKEAKQVWFRPATQKMVTFEEKLRAVAKAKNVQSQVRAKEKDNLHYFMHHVMLMKGVVAASEGYPIIGVNAYVTFGGQSLSAAHLDTIEQLYKDWMALEWEWQEGNHARPTFLYEEDIAESQYMSIDLECRVGKRYFRFGLLDFINREMGGPKGEWFPDLRPVVQENTITIHQALKLLGKLTEEEDRWPENLSERRRIHASNGRWVQFKGAICAYEDVRDFYDN